MLLRVLRKEYDYNLVAVNWPSDNDADATNHLEQFIILKSTAHKFESSAMRAQRFTKN